METLLSLLGLTAFPIVLIGFAYFIWKRNLRLPEETGLTPIYEKVGGGTFDDFNLSTPFVRISIYEKFLVISYTRNLLFYWNEITSISIKNRFFYIGVEINHKKPGLPGRITIWTTDGEKLTQIINSKLSKVHTL